MRRRYDALSITSGSPIISSMIKKNVREDQGKASLLRSSPDAGPDDCFVVATDLNWMISIRTTSNPPSPVPFTRTIRMHFDSKTEASRSRYGYTTSIIRLSLNSQFPRIYVGERRDGLDGRHHRFFSNVREMIRIEINNFREWSIFRTRDDIAWNRCIESHRDSYIYPELCDGNVVSKCRETRKWIPWGGKAAVVEVTRKPATHNKSFRMYRGMLWLVLECADTYCLLTYVHRRSYTSFSYQVGRLN